MHADKLRTNRYYASVSIAIKAKLKRGAFAATFLAATPAALETQGMRLEDFWALCKKRRSGGLPIASPIKQDIYGLGWALGAVDLDCKQQTP